MLLHETNLPDPAFALVPWVVLIPVIGILVNLLFGRRFNEKLVGLVASLLLPGCGGDSSPPAQATNAVGSGSTGASVERNRLPLNSTAVRWQVGPARMLTA